jgi:hypothetical protein
MGIERFEVRGDDSVVLAEYGRQAEAEAFAAGYTSDGNWGGYTTISVYDKKYKITIHVVQGVEERK